MCLLNKHLAAVLFACILLPLIGCAANTRVQFRYIDTNELVGGAKVVVSPTPGYANPMLPLKRREVTTSEQGEADVRLNLSADGKPIKIQMTDVNGGFYEWYVGDKDRLVLWQRDYWVGEHGSWVEGSTDARKYKRVEARFIEY